MPALATAHVAPRRLAPSNLSGPHTLAQRAPPHGRCFAAIVSRVLDPPVGEHTQVSNEAAIPRSRVGCFNHSRPKISGIDLGEGGLLLRLCTISLAIATLIRRLYESIMTWGYAREHHTDRDLRDDCCVGRQVFC
jgi:hypothetical protein